MCEIHVWDMDCNHRLGRPVPCGYAPSRELIDECPYNQGPNGLPLQVQQGARAGLCDQCVYDLQQAARAAEEQRREERRRRRGR